MSENFVVRAAGLNTARVRSLARAGTAAASAAAASAADRVSGARRRLRLVLAGIWLLDGLLQYQPAMFSKAFPRMLSDASAGNPAAVAAPIGWSATFVGHHLALTNGTFATLQVLLGLGIAFRPTVRPALAASILWSLAVWWLGEGFGGVLTGSVSPLTGAPGAVLLYAVLAVLLWPASREPARPEPASPEPASPENAGPRQGARFVAGRTIGEGPARAVWLLLWGGMAVLAVLPGARAPRTLSAAAADMAAGQPGWLAWLDTRIASILGNDGVAISAGLAVLLAAIAMAGCLPGSCFPQTWLRVAVVAVVALSIVFFLAQGAGELLTGGATDPDTGPPLALLGLAYWPVRAGWNP